MSTQMKEILIMALPHRDWSCESISVHVKLCPTPGKLEKKNHTYFIVEDMYDFRSNNTSLMFLAKNICQRFPHIPANRMHILLFRRDITYSLGMNIELYDFERDEKRQAQLKRQPKNVSEDTPYVSMCVF